MSQVSPAGALLGLALALPLVAACTCEATPVVRPTAPRPVPDPAPAESERPRSVLVWRVGTAEAASYLVAIPPYPARLSEVLPGARDEVMRDAERLVVLAPVEAGVAGLRRHGPGSARTSLREVLGEDAFERLVLRLGSVTGRPNRPMLASTDARGASVALGLAELGYRGLGESANEALRARAAEDGISISALLDAATAVTLGERIPEADVVGDLLERIDDPARTASWGDAMRRAFDDADPAALDVTCREPERTTSWAESARRTRAQLASEIAPSVERELATPHTVVALDACLLPGATGLVALLAERGVALAQLLDEPVSEVVPAEVVPAEAVPAEALPAEAAEPEAPTGAEEPTPAPSPPPTPAP